MLDIKYLRKNVAEATRRLQDRGIESEKLTTLLSLDKARREAMQQVESLKAKRNEVSDKIAYAKRNKTDASEAILAMQEVGSKIKALDARQASLDMEVKNLAAHLRRHYTIHHILLSLLLISLQHYSP